MPNPPISLFVQDPQRSRSVPAGRKFPVFIFVDPPDATVTGVVRCHGGTEIPINGTRLQFGSFNQIVLVDHLPNGHGHSLCLKASKAGYADAYHRCKVRRDSTPTKNGKKKRSASQGFGGVVDIEFPTGAEHVNSFVAWGLVDPSTTPLDSWVEVTAASDGSVTTYPGVSMGGMPGICDWSFSYGPFPDGSYKLYVQVDPDGTPSTVTVTYP